MFYFLYPIILKIFYAINQIFSIFSCRLKQFKSSGRIENSIWFKIKNSFISCNKPISNFQDGVIAYFLWGENLLFLEKDLNGIEKFSLILENTLSSDVLIWAWFLFWDKRRDGTDDYKQWKKKFKVHFGFLKSFF